MKVAILYDAGSDEWSPQDVAAVVGNVHEVRDVLRRRGHEVELLPVRLGDPGPRAHIRAIAARILYSRAFAAMGRSATPRCAGCSRTSATAAP